jgi:hypothetical protein
VQKTVNFVDQNALNLTNEHLEIQKIFSWVIPPDPVKRGREKGGGNRQGRRRGREGKEKDRR